MKWEDVNSIEDAFGLVVEVGDKVVFSSYKQLALGTVVKIQRNEHASFDDGRWAVYVMKEAGPSVTVNTRKQASRLTDRMNIAKMV